MKRKTPLFPIVVLALILIGLPKASAAAQTPRIEQKDGITCVYNGPKPASVPGAPKGLRLIHELTIGREDDPEESMIFSLRALQAGDEGKIFVLDEKTNQIKIFGADGRHLITFGKKGTGPKEFQTISRMVMTPDGRLCFLDLGNSRVSYYSQDGTCLKETPLKRWRPNRFIPDSRGFGYGDILDFEGGVKDVLMKFDAVVEKAAAIATLVIAENPTNQMVPIEIFRLTYQTDRQDRIIWASTGAYELNIADAAGKPVKKILREFIKKPYRQPDKEKLIKSYFGGKPSPPGIQPIFPPHRPVLYYFILDEEGRFYVRTYEEDGPGRCFYDVFDKEGRFFAWFSLPETELLMVIKGGKAYCAIEENEAGVPQVKRYALAWQ